ncbi:MAG: FtsX-like permease family protein [Gemmatimonadota bacterium]|nr:FtsX-like permease family protein [Gemmatimonadota bacterium]
MLIERPWAESVGVAVGDTVAVATEAEGSGCRAVVAGLFEPPPDPTRLTIERPRVIFHLPDLAAVLGRPDVVDRFSVRLTGARAAEWTAAELTAKMPGTQVLPTSVVTARASTTFAVIERFHGAIAVITLVAGGVFLACIMFLKVGERRSPVAALRLVGVSRTTLVLWVVAEAALISLAGGALGVGLGALASRMINLYYQAAYDTTLVFSLLNGVTVARALILAVALGLIAGFVAVVDLLRRDALAEAGG